MEIVTKNLGERSQQFLVFVKHAKTLQEPVVRKIVISAALVQLYSAVESTMDLILESIAVAAASQPPNSFADGLRREWLRAVSALHKDLNENNRVDKLNNLFEQVIQNKADSFKISSGGGGNWSDKTIEAVCERLGIELLPSQNLKTKVKRHIRDEMGCLEFVKWQRNNLSHGNISFAEASSGLSCEDVSSYGETVFEYLKHVVDCAEWFLAHEAFSKAAS
jgi:hypothetical protein